MTPKRLPPPLSVENQIEQAIAADPARDLTLLAARFGVEEEDVWAVVDRLDARGARHRVNRKGLAK